MKIATLNEKSSIPGAVILFESDTLSIDGFGNITPETLFSLDEKQAIIWEFGVQEKFYKLYDEELPLIDFLTPLNVAAEKSTNKKEINEIKEEAKPINRMILWGITVSILLLFIAGGGIIIYSQFFKDKTPEKETVNQNNVIENIVENPVVIPSEEETQTTNSIPEPVEYNFNEETAIKTVNLYYDALKNKNYALAYSFTFPIITNKLENVTTGDTIPTANYISILEEKEWVNNQSKVNYQTLLGGGKAITIEELKKSSFKVTADGREISIIDLKNVTSSTSFNSNLNDDIILCWNKFNDSYYIIDNNAIVYIGNYPKTFVKTIGLTTAEVQVDSIYFTNKKIYMPWKYVDNGSRDNIGIVHNKNKAEIVSLDANKYTLAIHWIGTDGWTMPQNLEGNLFTITSNNFLHKGDKMSFKIKLNILRNNEILAPEIDIIL